MNLDEVIKRYEEDAEIEEIDPEQLGYREGFYDYKERAEEYRQLAEWLKELKEYKDLGAKPCFTAKWVRDRGKSRKCSRCEFSINEDDAYIFHFCPDCGARMEVEE